MAIFVRQLSDNLASLAKEVEATVAAHQDAKMAAFVVILADKDQKLAVEKEARAFAEKHHLKHTALTIFEGTEGPENYKLSPDAAVTVLGWVKKSVQVNQAFAADKIEPAAAKQVAGALARLAE